MTTEMRTDKAAAATTTQRRQQMRLCDRVPITEASRIASVRWIRTWIRCSASKRSVPWLPLCRSGSGPSLLFGFR